MNFFIQDLTEDDSVNELTGLNDDAISFTDEIHGEESKKKPKRRRRAVKGVNAPKVCT